MLYDVKNFEGKKRKLKEKFCEWRHHDDLWSVDMVVAFTVLILRQCLVPYIFKINQTSLNKFEEKKTNFLTMQILMTNFWFIPLFTIPMVVYSKLFDKKIHFFNSGFSYFEKWMWWLLYNNKFYCAYKLIAEAFLTK